MAKSGIYCIQNTLDGKKYIGKAIDIASRWRAHRCELRKGTHVNKHLQRAWDLYGEDAFSFSVVEYASPEALSELEKKYIFEQRSFGPDGYNMTPGGEGQLGMSPSKEVREKISRSLMGRPHPHSEETRRKMSIAAKQHQHGPMDEATKAKISRALKGVSKEHFKKQVVCTDTGEVFASVGDAASAFGFSISGVSCVCRGKRKAIYGRHFSFMEDNS